jgi:HAD superfamily hydrolase (TIGR01509 family)
MKHIQTIIFDFDGTLADCKELHQRAFRNALNSVCPEVEYTDEEIEGRPTREKIRILHSKGYEFNGDKLNELKQAETQSHLEKYILFNVELFDLLHNLSSVYKLCVASNATDLFVNRSLEILQIKHLFQKINTATDYPAKPDTTTFEDCMRHTNSNYMNTLIVEDSPVGIQCATATGCQVLEVTNQRDTINKLNNLIKLPWPLPRTKEQ